MRCPYGLIVSDYFFCAITIDKDGAAKQIRADLYGVKKQDWCPLMDLPEMEIIQLIHLMLALQRAGISALMRLHEVK